MAATFPRAVVYDLEKEHHVTVIVCRHRDCVHFYCLECNREHTLPLSDLAHLKAFIASEDDMQCIMWVERNG